MGLSSVDGKNSMLCFLINGIHLLSTACWLVMLTECFHFGPERLSASDLDDVLRYLQGLRGFDPAVK
jgi:hypothetical protein